MPRRKGTPNTLQKTIDEIVRKHHEGESIKSLARKYNKPFKTILWYYEYIKQLISFKKQTLYRCIMKICEINPYIRFAEKILFKRRPGQFNVFDSRIFCVVSGEIEIENCCHILKKVICFIAHKAAGI